MTDTGSTDEQLSQQVSGLPSGAYAYFPGNPGLNLTPGASNFLDEAMTIEANGVAPGTYPFTVTFTGYTDKEIPYTATASGTLTVVANGVDVFIEPSAATPGSTYYMYVYNTGTVQDTFDLNLGGPGALVSSLAMNKVTLPPGHYEYIPITTSTVNFADSGSIELTATATSEGNPNVQNSARAELDIASTQGMTAQFQEPTQVIPIPGTADFVLLVNNTGNTQDSYSATITGTTGPVTASLTGLDGNPTQSIPLFILPGLSTGAIVLETDLTAVGQGTVTVEVQSLSNPNETATATATIGAHSQLDADPAHNSANRQLRLDHDLRPVGELHRDRRAPRQQRPDTYGLCPVPDRRQRLRLACHARQQRLRDERSHQYAGRRRPYRHRTLLWRHNLRAGFTNTHAHRQSRHTDGQCHRAQRPVRCGAL